MFNPNLSNEQKLKQLENREMRSNLVAQEYREQLLEAEFEALRQQIGPTARYESLCRQLQLTLRSIKRMVNVL